VHCRPDQQWENHFCRQIVCFLGRGRDFGSWVNGEEQFYFNAICLVLNSSFSPMT